MLQLESEDVWKTAMVAQSKQWTQNLYDVDYHLWLVDNAKAA